ncbi:MAG: acyl carrier protein [Rickettsiales bacterium]|jgi:acyl carrier protein|nr:acyl carrier protein [Rickettsiales bacterium]
MTTFDKVKEIVVEKLGVDSAKVIDTADFVNDLGADSLDLVEFVMEVEKEFNITIPDEDAGKLTTVGDAVKYIDAHNSAAKSVKLDAGGAKAAA